MPGHPDLPKNIELLLLRKKEVFDSLKRIDGDRQARQRILTMESAFRAKISTHIKGLPGKDTKFSKLFTSPFVLMFYSRQKSYRHVAEVDRDLLPAKVFFVHGNIGRKNGTEGRLAGVRMERGRKVRCTLTSPCSMDKGPIRQETSSSGQR